MIQKPAVHTSVTAYGPSVMTGSPWRASMTVAVAGAAIPAAIIQCPLAWSWSLNASIVAISSPVAELDVSSRTEMR